MFSTMNRGKKMGKAAVPYDKREVKDKKKAFFSTKKTVKPVAKDTNSTRRKNTQLPLKGKMKVKSFARKASNEPKGIK